MHVDPIGPWGLSLGQWQRQIVQIWGVACMLEGSVARSKKRYSEKVTGVSSLSSLGT